MTFTVFKEMTQDPSGSKWDSQDANPHLSPNTLYMQDDPLRKQSCPIRNISFMEGNCTNDVRSMTECQFIGLEKNWEFTLKVMCEFSVAVLPKVCSMGHWFKIKFQG